MIAQLKEKGIEDQSVLNAMDKVPRHLFLDGAFLKFAYSDMAFPIGSGQTISHPYTVAYQSSILEIKPGDKVLEIGTGSGYQTAVLLEMGAKVFSIERQKNLYQKTKSFLKQLNYKTDVFYGDGYKGLSQFAPFDKVIVTAGAPYIPEDLKSQLKIGGVMVIPVNSEEEGVQKMFCLHKLEEGHFRTIELEDFKFVPLLEDKAQD